MQRRFSIYVLSGVLLLAGLGLWLLWSSPRVGSPTPERKSVPAGKSLAGIVGSSGPASSNSQPANNTAFNAPGSTAGTAAQPSGITPAAGSHGGLPPILPPGAPASGSGSNDPPKRSIADVLEGVDLSVPGAREKAVAEVQAMEQANKLAGIARARELGLPLRVESPDGTIKEIAGLDDNGQPLYFITNNANAAISTGANVLQAAPYSLDGAGLTLGVWDGGSARWNHQEFGGRVTVKDGSKPVDHATHVAGTMIAAGVVASAKGMATAAKVDSYDWNNDKSKMLAACAGSATDTAKIFISNHSYGMLRGWNYTGSPNPPKSPPRDWEWYGGGTTATDFTAWFGLYNSSARDSDALAYSAPYYLMFRAAGNDRTDNPTDGQPVAKAGTAVVVPFHSGLPPGDGSYRGGFNTIADDALAKNVVTVGSVASSVAGGARSPATADASSFSSWGPTDDGRIKPDLVANGQGIYSCYSTSNTAYGFMSGTSMAAPNASGTAALVLKEYMNLFGAAMRASTLKGLLIHTADDIGNPGPDYKYGWGLINGVAAVDLVRDHKNNPGKLRINESQLTTAATSRTIEFNSDGTSPIRVTLCWTDPAGAALNNSGSRSARLRNNLDLKLTGPTGTQHFPYIMPFVGTWTQASMDLPATTGVNNTDNVEQVYIATPPAAGVYRATVSFQGRLTNNKQDYSLLVTSNSSNVQTPPADLEISTVYPASGLSGNTVVLIINGVSLSTANAVKLTRSGMPPIVATNLTMSGETLGCRVNLYGAAAGQWNVAVTTASGTATLANAFSVVGSLWNTSFDGAFTGWKSSSAAGANAWAVTSNQTQSSPNAYFASAPAEKTTTLLTSPSIFIPETANNLQLKFWNNYNLEFGKDGARLQISVDDGATWFDTDDAGSGVTFASNGYGASISAADSTDFAGKRAWSGNSNGFVQTILNLTDNAKFAGKTVRFRWVLATNASNASASAGWYVDSVSLEEGGDLTNQDPSINSVSGPTETTTDPDGNTIYIVRGDSAGFAVSATDDGGESGLSYTWSAQGPADAPEVFFSPNGDNASKNTTAYFDKAGDYLFTISTHDGQNLATTSSVMVRVVPTPARVDVAPEIASVTNGGSQQFTASLVDQFDDPVTPQPVSFTWSSDGGGVISSSGLFTASSEGGPFDVSAASASFGGVACVPTSSTNALTFLQGANPAYFGTALTGSSYSSWVTTNTTLMSAPYMDTSAQGTYYNHIPYALTQYIKVDCGFANVSFSGMFPADYWSDTFPKPAYMTDGLPSSSFLLNALKTNQATIFSFSNGPIGHEATAVGFNWLDANDDGIIQQSENATVSFVDPLDPSAAYTGGLPDGTAKLTTAQIWNAGGVAGGELNITYNQYSGSLPYESGSYQPFTGSVDTMFAVVPEPQTIALLVLSCLPFAIRWKAARAAKALRPLPSGTISRR